jgi:hypothetical protein
MPTPRTLLALLHFLIDRLADGWTRLVGRSWRSWSFPVQVGVLYTFLWGAALTTRPLLGQRLLHGAFAFLSPSDQLFVGGMLLLLTVVALWKPRRYALASTYLIAALKITDALLSFNPILLVFWLFVLHGVRAEIDADAQAVALVVPRRLRQWLSFGLLALTIFAWLRPTGGTLALVVAVCLIQTITALPRRVTQGIAPPSA